MNMPNFLNSGKVYLAMNGSNAGSNHIYLNKKAA